MQKEIELLFRRAWRQHYNRERPHGSLGNIPPVEFAGALVPK
ncbi:MAG: transposase [Dehalococcoidales bacterium]|nr:transposase [Dehalococcoidales bacterium]